MDFHYNSNTQISQSARVLSNTTSPLFAFLSTPVNGTVRWFTTSAFIEHTGLWRASINKTLKEYLDLGWVENISIDNIPVVEQGVQTKYRRRNLWKLSDETIGVEFLFNNSLDQEMMDLGRFFLNETGIDQDAEQKFLNKNIAKALEELGSDSILNFINSFQNPTLYYRDAVEQLRGNDISCPKHDKLSKLCDVEFTEIGIDLNKYKILSRSFTPDKSGGAPGYTYHLHTPGISFQIRSTIKEFNPVLYRPRSEDWQNAQVTASQISSLREGIIIG